MFDNLTHVQDGNPYVPSAGAHNAFVDTARAVRAMRQWRAAEPTRWDTFISPYIVTEKQSNQLFGVNENVFIDSTCGNGAGGSPRPSSATTFECKPYTDNGRVYGSIKDDLDNRDVDAVRVSARLINGVVFTGQLVLVATVGEYKPTDEADEVIGDVIGGPFGTAFTGRVTTEIRTGLLANQVYVDVEFQPFYETLASRPRLQTCRVVASNRLGITLTNGQIVYLQHMAYNGVDVVRWRVTEYECKASNGST